MLYQTKLPSWVEFLPHTKPPRKYTKTFHGMPPLYLVKSNTKAQWFLRNKWLNSKRLNPISFYRQISVIWPQWTSTTLAHSINARCSCEIFQSSFPAYAPSAPTLWLLLEFLQSSSNMLIPGALFLTLWVFGLIRGDCEERRRGKGRLECTADSLFAGLY